MSTRIAILATLLAAAAGSAQAADARYFISGGATFGGDTMGKVLLSNQETYTVHAGGLLYIMAGVDLRFTPIVSGKVSAGYHFDVVNASDGRLMFGRTPFEALGYFQTSENVRLGGGMRLVPKSTVHGRGTVGRQYDREFKTVLGSVIELEYQAGPKLGVRLRYVSEKYKSLTTPEVLDGFHGGVLLSYYFN